MKQTTTKENEMHNIEMLNTETKTWETVEMVESRQAGLQRIAAIRRDTIARNGNSIEGPHYHLTSRTGGRKKIIA